MFRELPSSYHLYIFPSKKRAPSRFRQSVIAPLRHLARAAETPLQSSRGCEEVSLSPMPSSRPICQIGFKSHESLRLCHRRAALFIAPAWVSYLGCGMPLSRYKMMRSLKRKVWMRCCFRDLAAIFCGTRLQHGCVKRALMLRSCRRCWGIRIFQRR